MQIFQSILQFKKVSCKNCYKCVRNCPVKAIRVHDHQARIIESQCIYCEKCILVCPQDAKEEQNMIPAICNAMENKTQVIASLHPAYLARFGVTGINGIREAMKKLGFADAADAAEAAFQEAEMSEDDCWRIFLDRLDGRELTTPSRLTARNFYFEDSIEARLRIGNEGLSMFFLLIPNLSSAEP